MMFLIHLIYLLKSPLPRRCEVTGYVSTPTLLAHSPTLTIPLGPPRKTQDWGASSRPGAHCPDLQQLQPWRLHLDRIPLLRLGGKQSGQPSDCIAFYKPCLPPSARPAICSADSICRNVEHKKDPSLVGPGCLKVSPKVRGQALYQGWHCTVPDKYQVKSLHMALLTVLACPPPLPWSHRASNRLRYERP